MTQLGAPVIVAVLATSKIWQEPSEMLMFLTFIDFGLVLGTHRTWIGE